MDSNFYHGNKTDNGNKKTNIGRPDINLENPFISEASLRNSEEDYLLFDKDSFSEDSTRSIILPDKKDNVYIGNPNN
jgi:hypothetical protein